MFSHPFSLLHNYYDSEFVSKHIIRSCLARKVIFSMWMWSTVFTSKPLFFFLSSSCCIVHTRCRNYTQKWNKFIRNTEQNAISMKPNELGDRSYFLTFVFRQVLDHVALITLEVICHNNRACYYTLVMY